MAAEAAFLDLREQLTRLAGLLAAVRKETRRKCPDKAHCVASRIYDAGPELAGLLRKSRRAAQLGLAAVREGGGGALPRTALTACECSVRKLRRVFRARLGGRAALKDLAGLAHRTDLKRREQERWAAWVGRVVPAIRVARQQVKRMTRAAAACWRELAVHPPGITIKNVAIGQQIHDGIP